MKTYAALFLAFFSSSSFATVSEVNVANLPANLICSAPGAKVRAVRRFKITKLNTTNPDEQPETTLREGFQEMSLKDGVVTISFSDECEGWYALYLKEAELTALKAGQISRITGEIEYDDLSEFFPGLPDSGPNGHDRTGITCKVAKTDAL